MNPPTVIYLSDDDRPDDVITAVNTILGFSGLQFQVDSAASGSDATAYLLVSIPPTKL